ncbi:MAG TPA: hypothetical protein VM577_00810, partial [Anaerovoracaceae bacterium]|nr:hypothetical protein [Anaerovoracaceae bacterium]
LAFIFENNDVSKVEASKIEYSIFVKNEELTGRFLIQPLRLRNGDLNYRVWVKVGFEKYSNSPLLTPYKINCSCHDYNVRVHTEGFFNINAELEFLLDENLKTKFSAFYNHIDQFDQKTDSPHQKKFFYRKKSDKELDVLIFEHFDKLAMFSMLDATLEVKEEKPRRMKI